jgi:phosphohistidine phosphatase SixA
MKLMTQLLGLSVVAVLSGSPTAGQTLSGEALFQALRHGGYVLVMRHTSSPRDAPDKQAANTDNINLERQLDANGRATAAGMGNALRELKIPIGDVMISPTYRALETVRAMQLSNPRAVVELGDGGQSMQGVTSAQAAWLRTQATQLPHGMNTILITHQPNMAAAFPQWTAGLADGETLVFAPDGKGGTTMVARIRVEQWAQRSFCHRRRFDQIPDVSRPHRIAANSISRIPR